MLTGYLGDIIALCRVYNRLHKQIVEDSFLLTLRTLFDAPASSPLASIDANNVAAFLVQLTMADERSAAKNSPTNNPNNTKNNPNNTKNSPFLFFSLLLSLS